LPAYANKTGDVAPFFGLHHRVFYASGMVNAVSVGVSFGAGKLPRVIPSVLISGIAVNVGIGIIGRNPNYAPVYYPGF
jgi:hypothetical protein